jgi:hypothetical protein
MPASEFIHLDEKLTFRFYIKAADKLTLHAWCTDNDNYKAKPHFKLKNSKPGKFHFGPGSYFGNLQLKGAHLRKIISQIKSTNPPWAYVLFVPQDPGINAGQINYTLKLTNVNPSTPLFDPAKKTTTTTFSTNPSPPRRGV